MSLTLSRSTLCLLALMVLFADGAIARQSDGCVRYSSENSNLSLVSVHLREQASAVTDVEVRINTKGDVSRCAVVKGSGSERLDGASCDWVRDHWHSLARCQDHRQQL